MRRSLLIGLTVFSIAAILLAGGTMAWFVSNQEVDNTFTAGTVSIEVNEHGFTDITNWNPGDISNKDVSVKSNGSKKTYVRVSITPQWLNDEGNAVDNNLSVGNVELIFADNDKWATFSQFDGYYYYKDILEEGEETEFLLDGVRLVGTATGNDYQGRTLRITVKAEGVQASHEAYKDAWGIDTLPAGVSVYLE